jgi:saccharopine dehydrogenase-like NADP-dependent oxidoreductase
MKRITVLGAGMVGSAIARDLARTGFDVTVADERDDALARVSAKARVATKRADLATPAAVKDLAKDADLVVGALSSHLGLQTVRAVIEARRPIVDISFMAEDALGLDALAKANGVAAVVDCGVAPGVSNLLCGLGVALLERCDALEIYVGGLPAVRSWPFEYKAGFAPHDVIEEYTRPSRIVEHGEVVVREALSEPELMEFAELGTLEAFNTDGLRSIATTLDVPFMKEKTLRYPGHIELMRVLRHVGLFSKDPIAVPGGTVRPLDVTAALLFPKWTFGEGEADVTVMRVTAAGRTDGRTVRHVWDLVDRYDAATGVRSMSRTTGYAATSMVALMARGLVAAPGVHPPELLGKDRALADAFLAEYASRGCRVTHREE